MLALLQSWGGSEDAFDVTQAQGDGPNSWRAELRARGQAGFVLTMRKAENSVCVLVSHNLAIPPEMVRIIAGNKEMEKMMGGTVTAAEEMRIGTLTCRLAASGPGAGVEIQAVIYEDGFSRHAVNAIVLETTRARGFLTARFDNILEFSRLQADFQGVAERVKRRLEQVPSAVLQTTPPPERRCLKCHAVAPPGAKFCKFDGTPIGR